MLSPMDDFFPTLARCHLHGHRRARLLALFSVVLAAGSLAGCVEPEDQDSSWSYVYTTIIQPNCTTSNCHSGLAATAGLQFHTKEGAYIDLTGRGCESAGLPGEAHHNFVVPYEPERSKLMYMLRGEETWRMPPDVALPQVEIDLVERWILEGATCE
jgi:hypothetical protein